MGNSPNRERTGWALGLKAGREYNEFTVVQTEVLSRKAEEFGSHGQYPIWNV